MEKKNKKATIIIISIMIVIILALAITFAYFSTQLNGMEGIVKVGALDLVLDETSEGISLDNAIGISDNEGLSLEGSTFKLINNGSKAVDYTIYLDDNTISDTDTRIDDKYLKYNLAKNGENSGAKLLTSIGSNPNRILDSGTIEGKSTNEYSLSLWITDEVDGNYSGQVFSGKLRVEVSQERDKSISTVLLDNIPKENLYNDGTDTFIMGEDPDNYIWYSGKLWRAVLVNNEEKTVKLVTQWNISTIYYDNDSSAFEGSYIEEWLNDTTVDGFLGNLREPDNFIVMDAKWNATENDTNIGNITRPSNEGTIITSAVGLLNMYEYQTSYRGTTLSNGYLNNGLSWWTLTPSSSSIQYIYRNGIPANGNYYGNNGIRPSVVLKSSVKIASGNGTKENPYRLEGDNDTNLSGTKLNTRYSGEYISFGNNENNLYRIVSHETEGLTKITSAEPLKNSGDFLTTTFGSNNIFSNTNTVGRFLNEEFLTNYLRDTYNNMVEDNTIWYLGTVGSGSSYKLAKYTDIDMTNTTTNTIAKVGLLRLGELMSGQFDRYENNSYFWLLNPYNSTYALTTGDIGVSANVGVWASYAIKPTFNLKSNIIITSGDGTLQNPFTLS